MPPSQKQRQEADPYLTAATNAIENAPSMGKRSTYLRLPAGVTGYFTPERGRTYRLLFLAWSAGKLSKPPIEPGALCLVKNIATHTQVGPNQQTYICVQTMYSNDCAQCQEFQRAKRPRMSDDEYAAIREMKPKFRELRLVHDLDGPKDNLQIWDESSFLFGDHFNELLNAEESYKYYAHPEKGYIIKVTGKEKKVGKGSCTDYATIVMVKLDKPMPKELVARARKISLDDVPIAVPYATLKQLVAGHVAPQDSGNGDGAVDETPTPEKAADEPSYEEDAEPATDDEPAEPEAKPEPEPEEDVEPVAEEEPTEEVFEEPEEPEAPSFSAGDVVTFKLKGKKTTGKVHSQTGDEVKVVVGKLTYRVKAESLTAGK